MNEQHDLLSETLAWMDPGDRAEILDSVACDLHNKGYELQGNTEAMDLEWLARTLWERHRGFGACRWDVTDEQEREDWRHIARVVLEVLPIYYGRLGRRCARYAEALRTWEKAERAAADEKRAQRKGGSAA